MCSFSTNLAPIGIGDWKRARDCWNIFNEYHDVINHSCWTFKANRLRWDENTAPTHLNVNTDTAILIKFRAFFIRRIALLYWYYGSEVVWIRSTMPFVVVFAMKKLPSFQQTTTEEIRDEKRRNKSCFQSTFLHSFWCIVAIARISPQLHRREVEKCKYHAQRSM